MATPEQIDRQIALETTQVQDGIAKLRADTAKAQDRQYASSTVYAQKLLKQAIPEVVIRLSRTNKPG